MKTIGIFLIFVSAVCTASSENLQGESEKARTLRLGIVLEKKPPLLKISDITAKDNDRAIQVEGVVMNIRQRREDDISFLLDDGTGKIRVTAFRGFGKLNETNNLPKVGDKVIVNGLLSVSERFGVVLRINVSSPIDAYKSTPELIWAVKGQAVDEVKKLIQEGTDVNIEDDKGGSPLLWAALWGNKEIIELLIKKGAEINSKSDSGNTPLMFASRTPYKENVKLLINNGAEVDATNNAGVTALMLAALEGRSEIVDLLIQNGADVNAKADDASTAISIARDKDHKEVVNILKKAGAEE
ncbi:MAG: exodeoxyribonuclease VII large subunit [bacterium]|nr:exodeoxyribonuclease VII large subunit [bacterium]